MSRFLFVLTLLAGARGATPAGAAPRIDFGRDIRPLLSDRCFSCHGPGEKAQKGGLRLDLEADALRPRKDGHRVIARGAPLAASSLWARITSGDPDEKMPPADSHLTLAPAEIDRIRHWLEQSAPWGGHWAFVAPRDEAPPLVPTTPTNPIDAFVRARAAAAAPGITPAPEASRHVLAMRLGLGLTGLPPSAAEVAAFVADGAPDAYERLVDRLLASRHHAERMAADWMDLARFADTYGYQADVDRDMSPWRDWVIRAFDDNLPFDQFLTWQLAGDLLPAPTRDQLIATAFGRLHRQTNEGGSIDEEFRAEYVADRVHTVGTAFLGLTFECSRCHDHKYDPLTQRDYYSLFAFFNNLDESGLYSHFTRATPGPALPLWRDGEEARHATLDQAVRAAEEALRSLAPGPGTAGVVAPPRPDARYALDEIAGVGRAPGRDADQKAGAGPTTPEATGGPACALVDGPTLVAGAGGRGRALRFSGDNSVVCKGVGAFGRTDPFSIGVWIRPTEAQKRAVVLHRSRAWSDSGSRGYELVLDEGRPFFGLIHFWPSNAAAVRARQPLPLGRASHVTLTHDGSGRAAGLRIYVDGRPAELEVVRDQLTRDIRHRKEWGDADVDAVHLTLAGRFRDSGFRGGVLDDLMLFGRELLPAEVRALHAGGPVPAPSEERAALAQRSLGPWRAAAEALAKARAARAALEDAVPELMVMRELPRPRSTFVFKRGAYDAPGAAVEASPPVWLLPFRADLPRNRLGLARWLTDPEHPLTARVAVNRIWRLHFGRGLVSTPEDFGAQGELPSHPALLDYLARRFVRSGWDTKALHRLIVTSATYRQSSQPRPELRDLDPDNRLLLRGPRHRLEAEQLRDRVLAASGLLVRRVGGPSVKPYQPAGLWEESGTGKSYVQDHGEALYRRSLYTFWRRTSPPPSMVVFDAPTREVCLARRERTATPLQALALLDDPQVVEAARVLAERLVGEETSGDRRIARATNETLGRAPDTKERRVLGRLLAEQRAHYAQAPEAAAKLLAVGERPRQAGLDPIEVAATTILVTALFNHDGFVMRR